MRRSEPWYLPYVRCDKGIRARLVENESERGGGRRRRRDEGGGERERVERTRAKGKRAKKVWNVPKNGMHMLVVSVRVVDVT